MHLGSRPRTLVLAVLSLPLLVACTATVSAGPSNTGPHRSGPGGTASTIDWHPCHTSFECGDLEVPLDWFSDRGATIELTLIRKRAASHDPIGSLLLNPGGPGAPGTGFLVDLMASGGVPKTVLDHFDLVSWDPHGLRRVVGCRVPHDRRTARARTASLSPQRGGTAKGGAQGRRTDRSLPPRGREGDPVRGHPGDRARPRQRSAPRWVTSA